MEGYLSKIHRIFFIVKFIFMVNGKIVEPEFAVNYFKQKNVQHIATFACWEESVTFEFSQYMINSNMRISYNNIQDNLDMEKILQITSYRIGVVLDLDCHRSEIIFDQFTAHNLDFNESYHWLSLTMEPEVPTELFCELPLTVESELTVALTGKPIYDLYDLYNHAYDHGGKLNVTSMGYWDLENGLKNHLSQFKYIRRQDFHGITLNIAIVLLHPPTPDLDTYLTTSLNSHLDTWSRFHYRLLLQLRDMFNFNINLVQADTWGYVVNGTYNGVMGEMIKGTIDISAAPFQYLKDRLEFVEYTVQTYVVKPYLLFRHPKSSNLRNPFLKPFEQNIWWLALNTSIICWVLLLVAVKIENHYQPNDTYAESTTEMALVTIGAVSQQGASSKPLLVSGRIIFFTLFFWALLMYQFYSASIVGSLLTPPPKFIKDLWDLADSDLNVGSENTPYTRNFFVVSTDPATINLYNKKYVNEKKVTSWPNASEGIDLVRKGGYALFIDTATAYKMIEDTFTIPQICELTEIEMLKPPTVSMVTKRHSPFKKMVIYGLRKITEAGLIKRLTSVYDHRKPRCPQSYQAKPVPVELKEFSPAIFLVLGGFVLASLIMLAETAYKHRRRIVQTLISEKFPATSESFSTSDNVSLEA